MKNPPESYDMRDIAQLLQQRDTTEGFSNYSLPRLERFGKLPEIKPEMIRSVILDLDGTLLSERGHLPLSAPAILQSIEATGRKVILASGRPPRSVIALSEELGTSGGIVALNGAWVRNTLGEVTTLPMSLSRDQAEEFFNFVTTNQFLLFGYGHNSWWTTNRRDPLTQHEASAVGFEPDGEIACAGQIEGSWLKLVVLGNPAQFAEETTRNTLHRLGGDCAYTSPHVAEISPQVSTLKDLGLEDGSLGGATAVTKLLGIRVLFGRSEENLKNCLFFGDSSNDHHLLAATGVGVTFHSASTQTKDYADIVIARDPVETVIPFLKRLFGV